MAIWRCTCGYEIKADESPEICPEFKGTGETPRSYEQYKKDAYNFFVELQECLQALEAKYKVQFLYKDPNRSENLKNLSPFPLSEAVQRLDSLYKKMGIGWIKQNKEILVNALKALKEM